MKQLILPIILLALSLSAGAQNKTHYVKQVGAGSEGGTTWEDASGDLQLAINQASAGDQIYVAAGTYTGGFVMKEGVTVLGGFPSSAGSSTTLADRKLPGTGENLTILDGLSQMRVLTQDKDYSTTETLWEGFVIQNGNATEVGTIVYENNDATKPTGIVFAYDATTKIAKMIALEETSGTLKWGPTSNITGATDIVDGAKNWTTIKTYIANNNKQWADYPVWEYIKGLRETTKPGDYNDWYLPAIQELEEIYWQRYALNMVLKSISKTELATDSYWSVSEDDSINAWYVLFSDGNVGSIFKDYSCRARAVRASSISDLTISSHGGGAYLMQGGVLRNSIVQSCQASTGGGVYLNKKARLEGCVVEGCIAKNASAVYVADAASLLSSTIVNNHVDRSPQYSVSAPEIGDYYYSDGRWGSTPLPFMTIGIVCYINPSNPYSGYILHKDEMAGNWGDCIDWAKNYLSGNWELPPIDVLMGIYRNKDILNKKLTSIGGGKTLSNNIYWSGSEYDSNNAWAVNFSYGGVVSFLKYNRVYPARAVRAF